MTSEFDIVVQCPVHKVPKTEEQALQADYVCVEPGCGQMLTEVVPVIPATVRQGRRALESGAAVVLAKR